MSEASEQTRFVMGGKPGPGRPKGSKNKLQEDFLRDVLEAWETRGAAAIGEMIDERPGEFVKMVAGLMPKDMNINVTDNSELTDDELAERVRILAAQLAPFIALGTGDAERGVHGSPSSSFPAGVH